MMKKQTLQRFSKALVMFQLRINRQTEDVVFDSKTLWTYVEHLNFYSFIYRLIHDNQQKIISNNFQHCPMQMYLRFIKSEYCLFRSFFPQERSTVQTQLRNAQYAKYTVEAEQTIFLLCWKPWIDLIPVLKHACRKVEFGWEYKERRKERRTREWNIC